MANGILGDLGLDRELDNSQPQKPDVLMRQDDFRTYENGSVRVSIEAQRAALGCSYMSSV